MCSPFATAAIRGVHPSLVLELRLEIEKNTKLLFVNFSRDFVQSYMFICAVGAICFSLPGETIHCCQLADHCHVVTDTSDLDEDYDYDYD